MNSKYTFRAIQQGQTQQNHVVSTGAGQSGQALVVQAAEGARYQLADLLTFTSPKKLQLKRQGQDLLVALPGNDVTNPDIVIKAYFSFKGLSLTGLADSGEPMVYDTTSSGFSLTPSTPGVTPETLAVDKTSSATLASSGGWFDSGWGLAAVGGGLAIAAVAGKSGGDSGTNASLTKIITYKGDQTKSVPSVTDFTSAGVNGVDASNITGILTLFPKTQLPLDSATSLQTLVDSYKKVLAEANGSTADATPSADPTTTDYVNLMGATTPSSISSKPQGLALLNDRVKALNATDADTYLEVKALADAVEVVGLLAQSDKSTTGTAGTTGNITQAQLTLLGVDVTATSLTAVSDAIRANTDDLSTLNSTAKLKALVTAYNTILAEANGTAADATLVNPTAADYAAIGADIGIAKTDAAALTRLNALVGNLLSSSVDTVDEINKLSATLDKIQTVSVLSTGTALTDAQKFSVDELKNLGLTGFTSSDTNNAALALSVSNAIRDKDPADVLAGTGTGLKLQSDGTKITVDQTQLERLQSVVSQEVLKNYQVDTVDSSKTTLVPTASDWSNLGVFSTRTDGSGKFDALSATQIAYLNTAMDKLAATEVNSTAKLQAIADAYGRLIQEANGSSADANASLNPVVADLSTVGVTGSATSGEGANLMLDIIANRTSTDVDTVSELQAMADTVAKITQSAAQTATDTSINFTPAELTAIGLRGASLTSTSSNLTDFVAQVKDSANDGTGANSLAELQSFMSLAVVQAWARDVNNDNTVNPVVAKTAATPTAQDYKDIGVVRAVAKNATDGTAGTIPGLMSIADINAVNDAIDALVDNNIATITDNALINTLTKVQSIASSYFKILNEANGTANDYVTGNLIQNTDGTSTTNNSIDLNINPTQADYQAIGVSGSFDANRTSLLNTVIAEKNFGQVDTVKEVQRLADTVDKVLVVAADSTYNAAHNLSLTELSTDLSLVGVNNDNYIDVLKAIQATSDDKSDADSFAELQSLVSFTRIKRYADDTNTGSGQSNAGGALPTFATDTSTADTHTDDWKNLIGLTNELGANYGAYNSAVDNLGSNNLGSNAQTGIAALQSMVTSYNKILAEANGAASDTTPNVNPLTTDYANLGLDLTVLWANVEVGNRASALSLFNDAIGGLNFSNVDTVTELKNIATAVGKVMDLAEVTATASENNTNNNGVVSGLSNVSSLTMDDLQLLGLVNTNKATDSYGSYYNNEAPNIYAAIQNSEPAQLTSIQSLQSIINNRVI